MSGPRSRCIAAAAAGVALAAALLAAFAWPGAAVPWEAQSWYEFTPARYDSPGSAVTLRGDVVRADGADAQGLVQLRQPLPSLVASDYRYFSYDVDAAAPATKRMLVWRGSEGQGVVPLPDAPFGRGTLDLAKIDAWKGTVESLSIASTAIDYLAPAALDPHSLELRDARLAAADWRGALAALWTDWSALRPWSGRSSNTGGLEFAGGAGASINAFAAAWWLGMVLVVFAFLGRVRARAAALPLLVGIGLLLALLQLRQLAARADDAAAAATLAATQPTLPLAAQPQLAAAALVLSDAIDAVDPRPRVLVHGEGRFLAEYPAWLLRRHDVATLPSPDVLPAQSALGDVVLVLVGQGDWDDPGDGTLRIGSQHRIATRFAAAGPLQAWRFERDEAAP